MSTYFGAAITIGLRKDFTWINKFIEALYEIGTIYAHPLDKPIEWNGLVELPKNQAQEYFESYIKQLQEAVQLEDEPPSIGWKIDGIGYIVDVYSKHGYITLSLRLCSDKKYKDLNNKYDDFEYYIRLLIKAMRYFPILKIWAGCLDNFGDPEWTQIEGQWWEFKIQVPQPEHSFQMLDVILSTKLNKDLLIHLINYAMKHNYRFFPINTSSSVFQNPQHIIKSLPASGPLPDKWIYICDGIEYNVHISDVPFARLLFRTQEHKNMPHIDVLVNHALNLLSTEILEQISSFDSRFNYLRSK